MSDQLDRIERTLADHVGRSSEFRETTIIRLDNMQRELTANTEVTTQVRDAANAARWIKRAVVWVGGLAAGAVGLWQLWALIRGGGGIGPTP